MAVDHGVAGARQRHGADDGLGVAVTADEVAGGADRAPDQRRQRASPAGPGHQGVAHHLDVVGDALGEAGGQSRLGRCRDGGRLVGRVRGQVEQVDEQLGPRDPVDRRVVDLADERDVAVVQALDDVDLPQGPGAVERHADDGSRQVGQLGEGHPAPGARAGGCGSRGRGAGPRPTTGGSAGTAPPPPAAGTSAARISRRATNAFRSSNEYGVDIVDGSMTAAIATWRCIEGVSNERNAESRPDNRSIPDPPRAPAADARPRRMPPRVPACPRTCGGVRGVPREIGHPAGGEVR